MLEGTLNSRDQRRIVRSIRRALATASRLRLRVIRARFTAAEKCLLTAVPKSALCSGQQRQLF
jgi:hypothetical protein